ncbi:MAG: hypothetical protein ACREKL_02180 [Chthoniobacterales bacterium]
MIKHLPFTDTLVKSLSALVPDLHIEIANSKLIRGSTAKGRYDTRIWGEGTELRTTFLGRGRNPLKQSKVLLRTQLDDENVIQEHAIAIRENERRLPWIQRSRDSALGDEIVMVKPFGDDPDGPIVSVRTNALTGFVSLEVQHTREMSPAEARLVAKALSKAAKLASVKDVATFAQAA